MVIVDDSEFDRYILKRQLLETGAYSIVERENGASALTYLQGLINGSEQRVQGDSRPLIILLDINMPKVDGFEFLKRFAVMHETRVLDPSVVMMFSSSERQQDKDTAMAYDIVHNYFVKGTTPVQDIRKNIEGILASHGN